MGSLDQSSRVSDEIDRRRTAREEGPVPVANPLRLYLACAASAVAAVLLTLGASFSHVDWTLVQAVPGTFWAALIVAPLALTGVILTNRSHDRRAAAQLAADERKTELQFLHDADRLTMQLDHAAQEATVKRETEMRRDVYLNAAEELVKAHFALSTLYLLDLTGEAPINAIQGFAVANAKLQIVADTKTSLEAFSLAKLLATTLIRALPQAAATRDALLSEESAKRTVDYYQQEFDRLITEIGSADPATPAGTDEIDTRIEHRRRALGWLQAATEQYQSLQQAASTAKLNFGLFLRPFAEQIGPQQTALIARLREELGLDGNEFDMQIQGAAFRQQLNALVDEMTGRIPPVESQPIEPD